MPFLFLSPSTQEYNPYVTSGNEEYWMNRLADRMVPYLEASGINVTYFRMLAFVVAAFFAGVAGVL